MRRALVLLALLTIGCHRHRYECRTTDLETPTPTDVEVCAHLLALGCFVEEDPERAGFEDPSCEAGFREVQAQVSAAELDRILRCYAAAESCAEVEACNRACGDEGGAIAYDAGDGWYPDAAAIVLGDAGP